MTSSPMIRHYTELFGVSPRDERRLTLSLRRASASACSGCGVTFAQPCIPDSAAIPARHGRDAKPLHRPDPFPQEPGGQKDRQHPEQRRGDGGILRLWQAHPPPSQGQARQRRRRPSAQARAIATARFANLDRCSAISARNTSIATTRPIRITGSSDPCRAASCARAKVAAKPTRRERGPDQRDRRRRCIAFGRIVAG